MRVLVLDDGYKQAEPIRMAFAKRRVDAYVCSTSNLFLTEINKGKFEMTYINADTWRKGRSIYDYFGVGSKLEAKPVVIYNVDEKFAAIKGRKPHERDRVLAKPAGIETAMGPE